MPKVHSTYIPPIGNEDADWMVVGEAGGKVEERKREPFVGKSGQLQDQYLSRNGMPREEGFFTNLSKYRPSGNKFKKLLGSRELEEGLAELTEEIQTVDPNLIIAAGGWPVHFLTGKTGSRGRKPSIMNWRGSILPGTGPAEGYKVFCCMHPAFILRSWSWHPVYDFDLKYASEQAEFPDIRYPQYETLLAGKNPEHPDYVTDAEAEQIVSEMYEAEWLEVDIETFTDQTMSCCGFADSADRTFVVTFQRTGGWEWVRTLLNSPAKKIFQYGTYDAPFLQRFYNWETNSYHMEYEGWDGGPVGIKNVGWDTYVAAATLMPEFPRGLDFLASIYTDFAYYKADRKEWKKDYDLNTLWAYNAKDNIAEFIVAAKQMQELSEMWDFDVPAQFAEV